MEDKDYYTIEAMSMMGGSFVSALGNAARFADSNNLQKIKDTFQLDTAIPKEGESFEL